MTIPGEGLVSIKLPNAKQHSAALDILIGEKRQEFDDLARSEKRVLIQRKIAQLVLIAILCASEIRAQEPSAPKKESSVAADSSIAGKQSAALPGPEHRFWDKKNDWLFAGVEAAGTGVSIGASYLFHRSGHHKLERWTSIVHFGLATTGGVRNYSLKTAHPKTTP